MEASIAFLVVASLLCIVAVDAFGTTVHHHNHHRTRLPSSSIFLSSSVSQEYDSSSHIISNLQHDDEEKVHPHSKLWKTTLLRTSDGKTNNSSSSYVHPSIELVVRPPSKGGTGIMTVGGDIKANTVAMSLSLEEVGMIDATSILDSYDIEKDDGDDDEVFDMLKEMWNKEFASTSNNNNSDEGKRLAVLAGIIAHLQLTRCKDHHVSTTTTSNNNNNNTAAAATSHSSSYALKQSRRLGLFLDAMPLLPQTAKQQQNDKHPFPTHFLYWTDDEIQFLLRGTMAQTKAREVRAGIGLVVREWSSSFLSVHSRYVTQTQILNAIFSSFAAVLSRSFGDAAGRDADGNGRMLVPLVDMLNHDGENPNVKWTWHVGEGNDEKISQGKGDIVVTTLCDVKEGEELLKCYGWRPAWDIASSYGFVPKLKKERWECTVIPLFPAVLDLTPHSIPTPNKMQNDETILDLLLESNYGMLVKAVIAAVDAANEIKVRQKQQQQSENDDTGTTDGKDGEEDDGDDDRPAQLNRLEVVSLFRPPPKFTADEQLSFPRRQPCVVVGTKVQSTDSRRNNDHYHRDAIESILPAFRAAASAISQLRTNHQQRGDSGSSSSSPIEASQMAMAAASLDKHTNWDIPAMELIKEGINDRIQTLVTDGKSAEAWLVSQNEIDQFGREHREYRADLSREARNAELLVLRTLEKTANDVW